MRFQRPLGDRVVQDVEDPEMRHELQAETRPISLPAEQVASCFGFVCVCIIFV